jgi:hypothetical protein
VLKNEVEKLLISRSAMRMMRVTKIENNIYRGNTNKQQKQHPDKQTKLHQQITSNSTDKHQHFLKNIYQENTNKRQRQ